MIENTLSDRQRRIISMAEKLARNNADSWESRKIAFNAGVTSTIAWIAFLLSEDRDLDLVERTISENNKSFFKSKEVKNAGDN